MEEGSKILWRPFLAVVLIIGAIAGNVVSLIFTCNEMSLTDDKLHIAVEEDWDFYLDGSPVDESKLSLGDYKATFSEDIKEVYLTKPIYIQTNYRTTSFIPFRY